MKKLLTLLLTAGISITGNGLEAASRRKPAKQDANESAEDGGGGGAAAPVKAASPSVLSAEDITMLTPPNISTDSAQTDTFTAKIKARFEASAHLEKLDLEKVEIYKILGLPADNSANEEVIKEQINSFRRTLWLKWHPDKAADKALATEIFKKIAPLIAFLNLVLLEDDSLKAEYNTLLAAHRAPKNTGRRNPSFFASFAREARRQAGASGSGFADFAQRQAEREERERAAEREARYQEERARMARERAQAQAAAAAAAAARVRMERALRADIAAARARDNAAQEFAAQLARDKAAAAVRLAAQP